MSNEYNAWKMAGAEPANTREYYGQILIDCVLMVFPGEKGSGMQPEPYDKAKHGNKRPYVQINATLDPLPEMQLTRETSSRWQNYSADWLKITMPSIKKLGFTCSDGSCDLEDFNNKWVKFQFVPGFNKNRDPEKPNYKTMEFLKVYKNEAECRQDYLAENGESSIPSEPKSTADSAVASALVFVRSIAENAMKAGNDVPDAVDDFLEKNSAACAGLKIDSPEIQNLLKEFDENPPF